MTDPNRALWAQGEVTPASLDLALIDDTGYGSIADAIYAQQIVSRGMRYSRTVSWPTRCGEDELNALEGIEYTNASVGRTEVIVMGPHLVAFLALGNGRMVANVSAGDPVTASAFLERVRTALPLSVPDPEVPQVDVNFWSLGEHGPVNRTRTIAVPPWEVIDGHYVDATAHQLAAMMSPDFEPGVGGQLFLWDGPPGTGKTYALRALAWQWREWCAIHYVTDPETFFGERASYMLDVLLHDDDDGPAKAIDPDPDPEDDDTAAPDRRTADGRWRLIVLEDAGELMSADARERSGQGLSRLLNVVDGLIGQGLRILVLVTTNEEVRKLHKAVSRSGRCAARVSFNCFPQAEARAWLVDRDVDPAALDRDHGDGVVTLADLFAIAGDRAPNPAGRTVGFVS